MNVILTNWKILPSPSSSVDSRGAECARAPPEYWGSLKGRSLISAYRSLAITASISGFEKLSTVLPSEKNLPLLTTSQGTKTKEYQTGDF